MIVMPLGPDFAAGLGIPAEQLGLVGGSYTAAAAVAGLLGSLFLDRFDRRAALAAIMAGLVLATAAGGLARNLGELVFTRVVAGAFGGPASALSLSIVADLVPVARRGKALGAVMASFSLASILGVPAGLELARLAGWRSALFSVAALGLVVVVLAMLRMPPMRDHLAPGQRDAPRGSSLYLRPEVLLTLVGTATAFIASFLLVPTLASYLQYNAGYPRSRLGLLYLIGGVISLLTVRVSGALVDRLGTTPLATAGTLVQLAVFGTSFLGDAPVIPAMLLFTGFMFGGGLRGVAWNTLTSRVPAPAERARFMSLQSAVQHSAAAAGAFLSAKLLRELPDHRLAGMPRVGLLAMALTLALPPLVLLVLRRLRRSP
ncbi:MAG: MFS transporter [Deltaproteobacteria bacterium]|nr:MFS transporter [Deltaproteobacteria bacterium]